MTRATVQYTVVKVLAALALTGSFAHAEAPRAAASDHGGAKAAPRTQPSTVKPRSTPKLGAPVAPAAKAPAKLSAPVGKPVAKAPAKPSAPIVAIDADDEDTDATPAAPLTMVEGKPMTAAQLMVEYQRIGRDLAKLQELRGTECTLELWPRFRAIKLDEMCKTPESRLALESELKDLRAKIDRRHGVELSAECLNNPLAANCQ